MTLSDAKKGTELLRPNERRILSLVHRTGPIARADITQHVPLSQQGVHRLIDGLENRGFLQFLAAEVQGRGKPSPIIELCEKTYVSLGVSCTTERAQVCLLALNGEVLVEQQLDVHPNEPQIMLSRLEEKLKGWSTDILLDRNLLGIGIAMQGSRNSGSDRFVPPTLLSNWKNLPLEAFFHERFKLPSFAENNATASATAEYFLGGGAEHNCFAYLSFNYGFGCGLFWQRKPVQGGHGNAGEISSIYTQEAAVHRPALGELLKRLQHADIEVDTISDLSEHFTPEHPDIVKWLTEVTPYLQQSLRALKGVLDPSAIFFGGEASTAMRMALITAAKQDSSLQAGPDPILLESSIVRVIMISDGVFFTLSEGSYFTCQHPCPRWHIHVCRALSCVGFSVGLS